MSAAFATTVVPSNDDGSSMNDMHMPDIPMPPTNVPSMKKNDDDNNNSGGGGGGGVPDFDALAARFAALSGK
tara:strand:+ start:337 stop:552 length:216 start_codon:yes stop_codon:yes gene_type:complete